MSKSKRNWCVWRWSGRDWFLWTTHYHRDGWTGARQRAMYDVRVPARLYRILPEGCEPKGRP